MSFKYKTENLYQQQKGSHFITKDCSESKIKKVIQELSENEKLKKVCFDSLNL